MTLEQIGGAVLMLLFLADIFLTVLYARAGTGVLAPRWNRLVWALVKATSRPFGHRRSATLSFAGPLIVVALIAFWALGLTVGAAFTPDRRGSPVTASGLEPMMSHQHRARTQAIT